MKTNTLIYISGPISSKDGFTIEQNVANALSVFFDCLRRGWPAFLPHATAIYPTAYTAISYADWLQYDLAVINRCTHMLMLPRWSTSIGATIEREHAHSIGIPVYETIEDLGVGLVAAALYPHRPARYGSLVAPAPTASGRPLAPSERTTPHRSAES